MSYKVRKIILPVAGIGKRLMPLTLTTPKNLIPLAGRPILEYALDEVRAAGLSDVILIVGPQHVVHYEEYLKTARAKYPELNFYIRVQQDPFGHGHAILQAKDLVKGESFAVRFCDDIIVRQTPSLVSLLDIFGREETPIILLEKVSREVLSRYGVVRAEQIPGQDGVYKVTEFVEKPQRAEDAPSDMIRIGGDVLLPSIMEDLERLAVNMEQKNDSLTINDAFLERFKRGEYVRGWQFDGLRLDCGTLEGLKEAEEYMQRNKIA